MLRGLMENVINNARKSVVVIEMELDALIAANPGFALRPMDELVAGGIEGYLRYLDALCELNDRSIHWLELKDAYLEKLLNLDSDGAQAFERLTSDRPQNEKRNRRQGLSTVLASVAGDQKSRIRPVREPASRCQATVRADALPCELAIVRTAPVGPA
ncbi:hypothetical protein THH46_18530 [Pseudomonas sp. NA13]